MSQFIIYPVVSENEKKRDSCFAFFFSGKQASKRFGGNDKLLKSKLNLVTVSPFFSLKLKPLV